ARYTPRRTAPSLLGSRWLFLHRFPASHPLAQAQVTALEQPSHEVAVAFFGADTPGARVRRADITFVFQDRHFVTNRRRTHAQIEHIDQMFGTDRFERGRVTLDNQR